jgi:hypothetical protein
LIVPLCAAVNAKTPNSNPYWWAIARLKNLCRHRYKGTIFLPDDDAGRSMLMALLQFGLTDEEVAAFGYWCEAELPNLKPHARTLNRLSIGKLIRLTTNELEALGKRAPWCIGLPIDQTAEEFEAWMKKRQKDKTTKRKQEQRKCERETKRAEQAAKERRLTKAQAEANPRHAAILGMLTESGGLTVAELVKRARKSHAFLRPSCRTTTWVKGPPPHAILRNLRDAVHRVLDQLNAKGAIKSGMRAGERGPERLAWMVVEPAETGPVAASKATVAPSHSPKAEKPNDHGDLVENTPCHATLGDSGNVTPFPTPSERAERLDVAAHEYLDDDSEDIEQELLDRIDCYQMQASYDQEPDYPAASLAIAA